MKFMHKITPHMALFISLGILLYIALASYSAQGGQQYPDEIQGVKRVEVIQIVEGIEGVECIKHQQYADQQHEELKRVQVDTPVPVQQMAFADEKSEKPEETVSIQDLPKAESEEQLTNANKKFRAEIQKENNAGKQLLEKLAQSEQKLAERKKLLTEIQEQRSVDLHKIAQLEKRQQQKIEQIEKKEQEINEIKRQLFRSRVQLAEATTKLSIANNAVEKAQIKAEVMLQYGKVKDRMLVPSQQKAATLEQQFRSQQAQVKQLSLELIAARQEIATARQKSQQLTEQVTALKTAEKAGQEEIAQLKDRLQQSKQEITQCSAKLEAAHQEIATARQKSQQLAEQVTALKTAEKVGQEKIVTLHDQLQNSELEQQAQQIAFHAQTDVLIQLQDQLKQLSEERNKLVGKIRVLDKALEEQKGRKIAHFEQEKQSLTKKIIQLTELITEKGQKLKQQKTLLQEAADQITALQKNEKKLQFKTEALLQYGKEQEEQLAPFQQQFAALHKQLEEKHQYLVATQQKLKDYAVNKEELVDQIARLKESVTVQNQKTEKLAQELALAKSSTRKLTKAKKANRATLADAQNQLNQLTAERNKLASEIKALHRVLEEQENLNLVTAGREKRNFIDKIANLTELISGKGQKLRKKKTLLQEANTQIAALQESEKKLQLKTEALLKYGNEKEEQLAASQQQIVFLEQQLEKKANKALLANTQVQLNQLTAERNELAGEVKFLQTALEKQAKQDLTGKIAKLTELIAGKGKKLEQKETLLQEANTHITGLQESEKKLQLKIQALLEYGKEKEEMLAPSQKQIADLQMQIQEQQENLAATQQELEESTGNGKDLANQVANLTESAMLQNKEAQRLTKELAEATDSIDKLTTELTQTQASLKAKKTELAATQKKEQAVQQRLTGKGEELTVIRAEVKQLTAELADQKMKNDGITKQQAGLATELQAAKTKEAKLSQQLETTKKELNGATTAAAKAKASVVTTQEKIADLEAQLTEKEAAQTADQKKIAALEVQVAELLPLQEQLHTSKEAFATLEAELANAEGLQSQLQANQKKITTLEGQLAALLGTVEEFKALQGKIATLEADLAQTEIQEDQLAAEQKKATVLEAQIAELQKETAEVKEMKTKLAEMEDLEQQAVAAKKQKERVDSLTEELEQFKRKVTELTAAGKEKEKLATELARTQKKLIAVTAANKTTELEKQLKTLQESLQEKEQALTAKSQALAQSNAALEQQANTMAQAEDAQKATSQEQLTGLQAKIKELEQEIAKLKEQLKQQAAVQNTEDTQEPSTGTPLAVQQDLADQDSQNNQDIAGLDNDNDGHVDDTIVLSGVNFTVGTARLTQEARASLTVTADLLKRHAINRRFEVAGYTDSRGRPNRNQEISEQRAEAVRNFLIRQGVAANLLVSRGYGQDNPIASNRTQTGRAMNRRVELHQTVTE